MKTLHLTVIGHPIEHSKSPWIHHQFAQQVPELEINYTKTEAPLDGFKQTVNTLQRQGYLGANVTVPFKQEAYQLAHQHSPRAAAAKAVNTLLFLTDGSMYADNTDGIGFIRDITENHHYSLTDKRILIIGAGGAARGLLLPLLQQSPAIVFITNRTAATATALVAEFSPHGPLQPLPFDALHTAVDVIIDCTSFASWPLPISTETFASCSLVYDLKYGQQATPIMTKAHQCGVPTVLDGFGMLLEQAAESFALWTDFKPDTGLVFAQARQMLLSQ